MQTTIESNPLHDAWGKRYMIVMTIDTWVSPETILWCYHAARQKMLGRPPRAGRPRRRALLRFLAEHRDDIGDKPWRELMNTWNRQHPEWHYRTEQVWSFSRDVRGALRTLLPPRLSAPPEKGRHRPNTLIRKPTIQKTRSPVANRPRIP
jgi:hypothetical protein